MKEQEFLNELDRAIKHFIQPLPKNSITHRVSSSLEEAHKRKDKSSTKFS